MKAKQINPSCKAIIHSLKFVLGSFLLIVVYLVLSSNTLLAQSSAIALTEDPSQHKLKLFEGYFQFETNPQAYIQITVKDNNLIAKQLWDGREYKLVQKSDLEFMSEREEFPALFLKNAKAEITGVKILNRIQLKKVPGYDPNRVIAFSAEQKHFFKGKYELQQKKSLHIETDMKGNNLVLKQLWDGKIIEFTPTSELEFYNKELSFPIKFLKEADKIKMVCFGKDVWQKIQ